MTWTCNSLSVACRHAASCISLLSIKIAIILLKMIPFSRITFLKKKNENWPLQSCLSHRFQCRTRLNLSWWEWMHWVLTMQIDTHSVVHSFEMSLWETPNKCVKSSKFTIQILEFKFHCILSLLALLQFHWFILRTSLKCFVKNRNDVHFIRNVILSILEGLAQNPIDCFGSIFLLYIWGASEITNIAQTYDMFFCLSWWSLNLNSAKIL